MIELQENSKGGHRLPLTPLQLAFLQKSDLIDVKPAAEGYRLVPRTKRVGAIHAHGLDIVVTPKVSIPRLLFMIGYALNPGFQPENIEGVEASGLWGVVAETLCRHAERALLNGVLLGYATEHATSTVVRGRIRVGDQITARPGRLLPVETSHDEYTTDIPENQLLRAAVQRMLSVPRIHDSVQRRLRHVESQLLTISQLPARAPLPRWRPSRLNLRYQPALRIAEIVLNTLSFEVGQDGLSIATFIVNMEKVFEDFVTTALTEAWSTTPGYTRGQFPAKLDTGGAISMQVDVVHVVDGKPRFVVDAKYKRPSARGNYPNADLYQVLAYCTALQVERGWLVYPSGTAGVRPRRVLHSPITITEYPLDLDVPPRELLAQVEELAQSAWR
ncbi:5-methylcytosine-specific restriction enzyme subunit McrC [Lentzea xinjiangensis]|uniref:5-methylcytosine-specific restriction enzyme subunit McrC n=1 Tax=Lentzea xinjiangensis TaxID=402600 RepID=A0A1H9M1U2_9PSEU|nr:restriction endonuclease [Lentzea xinjiangensis]SER17650.1 5-methylcytosine-specific restriction enzyme subunit McrC [Lentzea xinjiangensis]